MFVSLYSFIHLSIHSFTFFISNFFSYFFFRLAEQGKRILVVEKGKYVRPEEMTLLEEDANRDMFENGGIVSSTDGNLSFLGNNNYYYHLGLCGGGG